jgi:hypothetical protein
MQEMPVFIELDNQRCFIGSRLIIANPEQCAPKYRRDARLQDKLAFAASSKAMGSATK